MAFVFVGSDPESVESGQLLAFGDVVNDPDQRLIDAGLLVPQQPDQPGQSTPPSPAVTAETGKDTGADAART